MAFGADKNEVRPCLKFHSWIGGDRDGNPNVTVKATKMAMARGRETAVDMHISTLVDVARKISISSNIVEIPASVHEALDAVIKRCTNYNAIQTRNPNEVFRQAISAVVERLKTTLLMLLWLTL